MWQVLHYSSTKPTELDKCIIKILWCRKLHGSDGVQWKGRKEDYVMAGERKQFPFMSHWGWKKKQVNVVNGKFGFFTASE